MSDCDSSFDPELNFDNCILTNHENSYTSSESSMHLENDTEEPSRHCENTIVTDNCNNETILTCEELSNVTLEADEVFTFILGVTNKVERFLGKFEENEIKSWLNYQIKLLKTVLIRNCSLFNVGVENISGIVYIRDIETNEPVNEMKKRPKQNNKLQKLGKKKQSDNQIDVKKRNSEVKKQAMRNNFDDTLFKNSSEFSQPLLSNKTDAEISESTPNLNNSRHSERLERLKSREVISSDKLTYTSLKLPLSSSIPVTRLISKKEYDKICREKKRKRLLKAKNKDKGSATSSTKSSMEINKISNLGEQKKMRVNKNITQGLHAAPIPEAQTLSEKQTNKNKRNSNLKRKILSTSLDAATLNEKNKHVTNRKVRSFCAASNKEVMSPSKNPNKEKEGAQSKKRQSVDDDDDGQAKKAKIAKREVKSFSFSLRSGSSSGSTKRKLYSAISWLDSLSDTMQTTSP